MNQTYKTILSNRNKIKLKGVDMITTSLNGKYIKGDILYKSDSTVVGIVKFNNKYRIYSKTPSKRKGYGKIDYNKSKQFSDKVAAITHAVYIIKKEEERIGGK